MAALVAALIAAVIAATIVGAAGLSVGQAFRALVSLFLHGSGAKGDFPEWAPRLLLDIRLPRIVLALIAGAALSLCR
jgi:ABC-type Fe3+-siderophore transport system permease subunit